MVVYWDLMVVDNLCVNALLAYLARWVMRAKRSVWRVPLAALLGTAAVFPYLYIGQVWAQILYKIGVLFVVAAPLGKGVREYGKCMAVYAILSMLLGGVCYACGLVDTKNGLTLIGHGGLLGVVCLGCLALVIAVRFLVRLVGKRRHAVSISISLKGGKKQELHALYDSGNLVVDGYGRGVVFVDTKWQGKLDAVESEECVQVQSVAGSRICTLYEVQNCQIYSQDKSHIVERVCIAFVPLGKVDALLPSSL